MDIEEKQQILNAMTEAGIVWHLAGLENFEMDSSTWQDRVFVEIGHKHWRVYKIEDVPSRLFESCKSNPDYLYTYNGTPIRFGNGKFKYIGHGIQEDRDIPCIPDYACKEAEKSWPTYVKARDPRTGKILKGPAPFRTEAEKRTYQETYGLAEH